MIGIYFLVFYAAVTQAQCPQGLIVPESILLGDYKNQAHFKKYDRFIAWWRCLPTIGLDPHPDWPVPFYPFLPHHFSLYELAPLKGKNSNVALLDNGVAGKDLFSAQHTKHIASHRYLRHSDCSVYAFTDEGPGKASWNDFIDLVGYHTKCTDQIKKRMSTYRPDYITASFLSSLLHDDTVTKRILHSCFQHTQTVYDDQKIPYPLHIFPIPLFYKMKRTAYADKEWAQCNHGSHCAGLITARSAAKEWGIAPYTSVLSLKVIPSEKHHIAHTVDPIIRALEYVNQKAIAIVSLSYSANALGAYQEKLRTFAYSVPFLCIAAGNGLLPGEENYLIDRFSGLISVGSYTLQYDQEKAEYTYPISTFSRSCTNSVWHVVLPGESMVSCCFPCNATCEDNLFVSLSGTSCATPLLAGFLALMVAEFFPVLSYDQIRTIVHHATVYLHDRDDWKAFSGLGTVDMRMALFMGHVIQCCMRHKNYTSPFFLEYVRALRRILLSQINAYGKENKIPVLFEKGMIDFLQKARKTPLTPLYTNVTLEDRIKQTAQAVHTAVSKKGIYAKE